MAPASTADRVTFDVHASPEGLFEHLAADARAGLSGEFKELPPKYFYDDRGSRLFEAITAQPEYYPTRCEREILEGRAVEIALAAGSPSELVELGAGSARKTRLLLDALAAAGKLERYVPVDICHEITEETAHQLVESYEGLSVHGVICDFERHLELIPDGKARLIAFLGGTIGNFGTESRHAFLRRVATLMGPDDRLLLGTDLVKDTARLEAAYDDAAGVTAEFNKNVLEVLNRSLGGDFDLASFDHVARYDAPEERMDIRLRARSAQTVTLPAIGLSITFDEGEEMRTELSCKFTRGSVEHAFAEVGLRMIDWFTDPEGLYALSLASVAG